MNQQEETEHEHQHRRFEAITKRLFPTMTGVVSLGYDIRKTMKAEREALRKQAQADRATQHKG